MGTGFCSTKYGCRISGGPGGMKNRPERYGRAFYSVSQPFSHRGAAIFFSSPSSFGPDHGQKSLTDSATARTDTL